ncbi:hypothetical protein [Leifsonia sp. SIMBA_070]|uniref:hypothetical protein n=1 Tax=Leifsonia sp. SIMBA_070 TaxID=3085810 RepID=UPI00397C7A69
MSAENTPEPDGGRRRPQWPWIAGAAAFVLLVGGVWWGVAAGSASQTSADGPITGQPSTSAPAGQKTATPDASAPSPSAPADKPTPTAVPGAAGAALPQREPVALNSKTTVDNAVTVTMSKLESVKGEAQGVGETAGPSIRFTLDFANAGDAAYATQQIVVNAYFGQDNTPSSPLSGPGVTALPASIPAHSNASATYVFTVPEDQRGSVVITVDYQAGSPAIAFQGAAPK